MLLRADFGFVWHGMFWFETSADRRSSQGENHPGRNLDADRLVVNLGDGPVDTTGGDYAVTDLEGGDQVSLGSHPLLLRPDEDEPPDPDEDEGDEQLRQRLSSDANAVQGPERPRAL